ncbi:MAG: hypothetical protein RIG77_09690 [Cyclobacteriaceae bacterium]
MNKAKICILLLLTLTIELTFGQDSSDCPNESCLEKLHFDSVRLNNKIPLMLTDAELIEFLGQPDSVVVESWECGNYIDSEETVRVLYFGRTRFISSNGTSLLHRLNFEENGFSFDFEGTQLKSGISKTDLQRIFPNALNSLNNKIQRYNEKGRMKVKMLPAYEGEGSCGWIFTFNEELLKEIELWWMIC